MYITDEQVASAIRRIKEGISVSVKEVKRAIQRVKEVRINGSQGN